MNPPKVATPMKQSFSKIWSIVSTVLVGAVVVLAVLLLGGRLLGWQVFTVVSGSMEPVYHVGDLLYVRPTDPADLQPGDVITFVMNEQLVVGTHRSVEVEDTGERLYFYTKGDANAAMDAAPVAQENVLGTPVFSIPLLGYVAAFVQQPPGSYVAVAVGAVLLALVLLPDLPGSKKRREHQQQAQQAAIDQAVAKALAEERARQNHAQK